MKKDDYKIMVGLYIRVSTIQQVEEGFSLEAQKEQLLKYAKLNNYEVYKVYEEQGKSGKNTNRPAFQEMMKDMKNKYFSKIIVVKLDRISRSVSDLETIIKELQENNCGFESASEKIDTASAMGLMFVRLLGIFAQFERERISERIKDVFVEKINNGGAITSNLPVGYKIGYNEKNEKIVVKDEEKSTLVEDIFNKYEETSSLIKTAIYLNNAYPDLVYKGGYTTTDIKRIMKNTMYYGKYKDNDNYCEPYIDYKRWKKINNMRENKNLKFEFKYTYLFSGIIKGSCSHRLTGAAYKSRNGKNLYYAYRCCKHAHTGSCKNNLIRESVIEENLIKWLPKEIEKRLKVLKINYEKLNKNLNENKNLLKNLESERKRIVNSYNRGWIDEEQAEIEINNIDNRIKSLNNKPQKEKIEKLEKIYKMEWLDVYKDLSRENKQLFYRSFIDYIIVDVEKYRKGEEKFVKVELLD